MQDTSDIVTVIWEYIFKNTFESILGGALLQVTFD